MADQIDFSKYGGSSSNAASSVDFSKYGAAPSVPSTAPDTSGIDFSKYSGSQASQPSTSPWKGILNNPISNFIGNSAMGVLNGLGDVIHTTEQLPIVHNLVGGFNGAVEPFTEAIQNMTPNSGMQGVGHDLEGLGQAILQTVPGAIHGLIHPDQQLQDYAQKISSLDPLDRIVAGALGDPASFVPLGPIVKGIGLGGKALADLSGATPYLAKAADTVASAPYIRPALQGAQDAVGNMFTKNYGASPALVSMIKGAKGDQAVNEGNILSSLSDMSQGHNLSPDELDQIGHVVEGTMQGTPEQQAFAQQWSDLANHGPQMPEGVSPIGSNAMATTASAVNGEPILQNQIPNHFSHQYDSVPSDLQGIFPKKDFNNGSGLSPNGTFNKPRTYDTLQEAQANGLKPVLNPFQVLGNQLRQSSTALTNNSLLQQIKNEPGLLLPQDKIDELYKLVKTGRIDSPQVTSAMQALGLTAKDLKSGGIVQSKIPQLSGFYIRKADEAALQDHLSPAQPTGLLSIANKVQNTYNKGYLLNPVPHLHNVSVNGVVLGGAKVSDIKSTLANLKNGTPDPMYQRALKAGALSNPVSGKFSDAIDKSVAPNVSAISKTGSALKNLVTNKPQGLRDIGNKLVSTVQPARDASHNLLWNTDAAIRTSLFKNIVSTGGTDAEAAAHVNKFMVDYNNLTPFERQYIKPLIPFYSWKKGNIPLQISQMLAQSPKYAAYANAKNAASQAISGQPTDKNGRVASGQILKDGSQTMVDPYSPMDDVNKIGEKGVIPYLWNSLSPAIKEGINQGSSLSQALGLNVQNKFPIYNPAAPAGYNIRAGLAHAVNSLNPLSGSAIAGEVGNQSNLVNQIFGMPTNNKPNGTQLEAITKLLGGFTARDNPVTDAKTQYYQQKDNNINFRKYMKQVAKTK